MKTFPKPKVSSIRRKANDLGGYTDTHPFNKSRYGRKLIFYFSNLPAVRRMEIYLLERGIEYDAKGLWIGIDPEDY